MAHKCVALAGAMCMALTFTASADVVDINITGGEYSEYLDLPDGQWTEGRDWGWFLNTDNPANGTTWMNEHWLYMGSMELDMEVVTDGVDPDVTITKTLTNSTGIAWTSFNIDLLKFPGFGNITVYPGSVGSSRFSSNSVTNFGSGDANILFTQSGGDTPVLPGQSVSFFFTFNIPGDVAFRMIQTPIPVPGALALAGVAGLVAARRRR